MMESQSPQSTIIAVFDAANSGGFLGLPYTYEKQKKADAESLMLPTELMTSQVIEISSTRKNQPSFSGYFGTDARVPHGCLTWFLLQYLKAHSQVDLSDLVSYLYAKCESTGPGLRSHEQGQTQLPLLSSSRKLSGKFALF